MLTMAGLTQLNERICRVHSNDRNKEVFVSGGTRKGNFPTSKTNVAKHPNRSSPPKLGGVARRRFISRAGVVPDENHPVCAG